MILGRLRRGELLVLLGLIGLVVSLERDWFSVTFGITERVTEVSGGGAVEATARGEDVFGAPEPLVGDAALGWTSIGHPWIELVALLGLALIVVLVFALRAGPGRPTYGAMVSLVLAIPLGALVLLATLLRTVVFTPGFEGVPSEAIGRDPAAGTWIALASMLVALVGLWMAMADDRTNAAASTYVPPAARPVPPLRPDAPGATDAPDAPAAQD